MRRSALGLALAAFLAVPPPAAGQPTGGEGEAPYQPTIVPPCQIWVVPGAGEVCGYVSIEDVRRLYEADAELAVRRARDELRERQLAGLLEETGALRRALAASDRARTELELHNQHLTRQLLAQNRRYEEERAKPHFGLWVGWGAAAVLGAALVAYVAADVVP